MRLDLRWLGMSDAPPFLVPHFSPSGVVLVLLSAGGPCFLPLYSFLLAACDGACNSDHLRSFVGSPNGPGGLPNDARLAGWPEGIG